MSRPAVLPALALALLTILPAAAALVGPATPVDPPALVGAGPAAPRGPEAAPKTEAAVLAQAEHDGLLEHGKVRESGGFADAPGVLAPCPGSASPTELVPGVGVVGTDPSTSTSDDCHYTVSTAGLDLTGKRLRVGIDHLADHDPYVKFGSPATVSPYDCSSVSGNTTHDECSVDTPQAGTYYVRVSRFSSTAGDFTVTAFVEDIPVCPLGFGPHPLTPGVNVTSTLPGVPGARCYFTFTTSSNLVRVNMTPALSTDNYNLYVRRGALPTSVSPNFDCSSLLSGTSTDTCPVINNGTTLYAMVLRSTGTNGNASFNIRLDELAGCSAGDGPIALSHDLNLSVTLGGAINSNCQFTFDTGPGADLAKFFAFPTGINVDLAVAKAWGPTNSATAGTFDCRAASTGTTTTDTCSAGLGPGTYRATVWRPAAGAATTFNVKAQGITTCSLGPGTTELLHNLPAAGSLANEAGAACHFRFTPPLTEDSVRVSMAPPPTGGDFDLYVRKGAPPSTSTYDCRPFLSGNATETCTLANDGTPVYAMVRRFSGLGAFTITAAGFSPCSLGNGDTTLLPDAAATGALTGDLGAACFFRFVPDALAGDVAQVDLTPPAGSDFDLYLKKGSRPSTSVFDCKASTLGDAAERCGLEVTDATPVFAMVSRVGGSGDFAVTATTVASCSLGLGDHALGEATTTGASLLSFSGAKCFFVYDAQASRGDSMRFTMAPPAGSNFDVYARRGARPSTTTYDCRPFLGGSSTETCELEVLSNGPVYLMVRQSSGGGAFTVAGQGYDTCSLGPGTHVLADGAAQAASLTGNSWAKCNFVFQPAANADFAQHRMTLTTSDFDLYVRKGAPPTASLWDCRPYTGGTTAEECNALIEDGSAYYSMVKRFSGSGGFNLTASNVILPQLGLGQPKPGNVATGQVQYWKVIVPADAVHLTVAIAGDPTAACATLQACHPAAFLGTTLCAVRSEACEVKNQTLAALCPQAPQACAPLDPTDADLYVRHIGDPRSPRGLPTTSLYTCRSATPGSVESCSFNTALNETIGQTGQGARLPANAPVVPMPSGGGKFFIGVRGADGPARYLITAAWALPVPAPSPPAEVPALPALPALPEVPGVPTAPELPPLPVTLPL